RDMAHVAFVKNREWKAKLSSKLFEAHLRALRLGQDIICRFPNRWQIVHQCPRPIKNDITDHAGSVAAIWVWASGARTLLSAAMSNLNPSSKFQRTLGVFRSRCGQECPRSGGGSVASEDEAVVNAFGLVVF